MKQTANGVFLLRKKEAKLKCSENSCNILATIRKKRYILWVCLCECVRLIGAQPCGSWWRCWRCCSRSRPVLQKVRHGGARSFAVNLFKLLIWHDKNGTECTPSVVILFLFALFLFKSCTPHPGRERSSERETSLFNYYFPLLDRHVARRTRVHLEHFIRRRPKWALLIEVIVRFLVSN